MPLEETGADIVVRKEGLAPPHGAGVHIITTAILSHAARTLLAERAVVVPRSDRVEDRDIFGTDVGRRENTGTTLIEFVEFRLK